MTARIASILFRSKGNIFACSCKLSNQMSVIRKRCFSSGGNIKKKEDVGKDDDLTAAIEHKYKFFRDEDSQIIFDVTEEMQKIDLEQLNNEVKYRDPYEGLNMQRGVNGVFEIEDLVALLKKDNAKDIFVATVPKKYTYVDYIVVVTAKSKKHMNALMQFVRKAYKLKRHTTDVIPTVEGKNGTDWQAIDLGNIALHIFSEKTREIYDLETLWSVGSKYDDLTNKKDEDINVFEKYSAFVKDYQPADS